MSFTRLPVSAPFSVLVLGGARSGKSAYGERLVQESGLRPVYLATAEARDEEMAARIAHHKARREGWRTVEEPVDLAGALQELKTGEAALVDCLTLWLSNLLEAERDVEAEIQALLAALPRCAAPVVFISNEVGLGIVPDNALARRFRDEAGRLNQQVAAEADAVIGVMAGLPLVFKAPQ
ncbi:bifunctional adenosylcobinamide kinase/adenosylcobinamide-phosphate guanylyltransferase [Tepidicaulis sp. LMO-SS28]|uniref:bifunctional adenosylcobinamide kinase/adenosylcobinamide-phosphate guanylyltransferase n=1 Tax=Tepidicaulis sp. LMO-SS28 TaxID=3447455 RepID=UPI003EDEFA09